MSKDRAVAQFFFEVGFGACWAEAYIKNCETAPFELTAAVIERAWELCPEDYEDGAEFDRHRALAEAAPLLLEALEAFNLNERSIVGGTAETLTLRLPIKALQNAAAAIQAAKGGAA